MVATADPATLRAKATWYLATNLPRPGGPREDESPHPVADPTETVRIHVIRHRIEQSYKQVKARPGPARVGGGAGRGWGGERARR